MEMLLEKRSRKSQKQLLWRTENDSTKKHEIAKQMELKKSLSKIWMEAITFGAVVKFCASIPVVLVEYRVSCNCLSAFREEKCILVFIVYLFLEAGFFPLRRNIKKSKTIQPTVNSGRHIEYYKIKNIWKNTFIFFSLQLLRN